MSGSKIDDGTQVSRRFATLDNGGNLDPCVFVFVDYCVFGTKERAWRVAELSRGILIMMDGWMQGCRRERLEKTSDNGWFENKTPSQRNDVISTGQQMQEAELRRESLKETGGLREEGGEEEEKTGMKNPMLAVPVLALAFTGLALPLAFGVGTGAGTGAFCTSVACLGCLCAIRVIFSSSKYLSTQGRVGNLESIISPGCCP